MRRKQHGAVFSEDRASCIPASLPVFHLMIQQWHPVDPCGFQDAIFVFLSMTLCIGSCVSQVSHSGGMFSGMPFFSFFRQDSIEPGQPECLSSLPDIVSGTDRVFSCIPVRLQILFSRLPFSPG